MFLVTILILSLRFYSRLSKACLTLKQYYTNSHFMHEFKPAAFNVDLKKVFRFIWLSLLNTLFWFISIAPWNPDPASAQYPGLSCVYPSLPDPEDAHCWLHKMPEPRTLPTPWPGASEDAVWVLGWRSGVTQQPTPEALVQVRPAHLWKFYKNSLGIKWNEELRLWIN